MKIKIKKSEKLTYWYADKIGKEFDVISEDDTAFVVNKQNEKTYYVFKDDAEIIKEEQYAKKQI